MPRWVRLNMLSDRGSKARPIPKCRGEQTGTLEGSEDTVAILLSACTCRQLTHGADTSAALLGVPVVFLFLLDPAMPEALYYLARTRSFPLAHV